jgi:hypothetical protein
MNSFEYFVMQRAINAKNFLENGTAESIIDFSISKTLNFGKI